MERIIITGGGTGGHIFPAIAIADAIKKRNPGAEILFVGAQGRMEMEAVPKAGYRIVGLDIQGLQRRFTFKNLLLPFKILKSLQRAKRMVKEFKPEAVIGVGGYASGPMMLAAKQLGIPYFIQEQNSFAGLTNKRMGQGARLVFVAYEGMDAFFPKEHIRLTGNPIRRSAVDIQGKREQALAHFKLKADKKTLLVVGGSLGAGTFNKCVSASIARLVEAGIQVIWQSGKSQYEEYNKELPASCREQVVLKPFLEQMDLAYAAADLIISRAGAGTISELCVLGKPVILVPSPNVAEDHQTRNAEALVRKQAALLVADGEAPEKLIPLALQVMRDEQRSKELGENIKKLAIPDADERIVKALLEEIK